MREKKVYLNIYVRPALKAALEACAAGPRERRNLSNVTEALLEWAHKQLQAAGTITELLDWTAIAPAKTSGRRAEIVSRPTSKTTPSPNPGGTVLDV